MSAVIGCIVWPAAAASATTFCVALGAAARDGHGGTGFGEAERERPAEALVAAGHQGGAAGEVER